MYFFRVFRVTCRYTRKRFIILFRSWSKKLSNFLARLILICANIRRTCHFFLTGIPKHPCACFLVCFTLFLFLTCANVFSWYYIRPYVTSLKITAEMSQVKMTVQLHFSSCKIYFWQVTNTDRYKYQRVCVLCSFYFGLLSFIILGILGK